jgi:hypothetical protein
VHRYLVICAVLIVWSVLVPGVETTAVARPAAPHLDGIQNLQGDIETFLTSIAYGEAEDGRWRFPSLEKRAQVRAALTQLLAGQTSLAAQSAQSAGFALIKYTDPARGLYYILRDPPITGNISPGGTYVWRPSPVFAAVVEVPHPADDARTHLQGIELFLDAGAELLILAGTSRRSDATLSPCDDAVDDDFRRSDAAHAVKHLFHVAHEVAEDELDQPLFIQLHGFGSEGYDDLLAQCGGATSGTLDLLVNISDGFRDTSASGSGAPPAGSFARVLADAVNDEGSIRACLYNQETSIYGGTSNAQGRYTNGSVDACTEHAPESRDRFLHLEQSYDVRTHRRALMNSLITEALGRYYGP